jgi:hypothetical protein
LGKARQQARGAVFSAKINNNINRLDRKPKVPYSADRVFHAGNSLPFGAAIWYDFASNSVLQR